MKKRIKVKKKRQKRHKFLLVIILFSIVVRISNQKTPLTKLRLKDNKIIHYLVENTLVIDDSNMMKQLVEKALEKNNPIKTIYQEYNQYVPTEKLSLKKQSIKKESSPLIYLYNTHQTEEYHPSDYIEFSINPTVMMNDYILEDVFEKKNLETIVETTSISDILKQNNWKYSNSYKASRILLENAKKNYPSLKYFIDIHRDSIRKEKTTIDISDKSYASILFIVGLENPNYEENLSFTELIHQKINEKYPNLSKGIYRKSGVGVNGIYNQDFSPYTILIEIGGYENTTNEVLNTTLAFAECFMEVIHESNS